MLIPRSSVIKGLRWQSERIPYADPNVKGDTFPMTWADDGEIYASAGDPLWGETDNGLDVEKFSGGPEDYRITKLNPMNDYLGWGGYGAKPSGMICVDGTLYLAFQNMLGMKAPAWRTASQHGSDAAIVYAATTFFNWTPAYKNLLGPTFPGHLFGGPAFINFGRNNEHARDGCVYAVSGDQWDNGANLRLGRVPKDVIPKAEEWEFVAGFRASGEPVWTKKLAEAVPVLSAYGQLGLPEMVYLAGIERYLLFTWALRTDFRCQGTDLLVFEAPEPWGPFSLAHAEENWEDERMVNGVSFTPYCPRLPLKWMEQDGKTGWLQFSGGWEPKQQELGYYRSNVRKFELVMG